MVKIVWTELSVKDLRSIHGFILENSKRFARITVERIYRRAYQLSSNPKSGRKVPEINDDSLRELILGNYRIIYFIVNEDRIDVLRVVHSARTLINLNIK